MTQAVVIGSSGSLGASVLNELRKSGLYENVLGFSRTNFPYLDYENEQTIIDAAEYVRGLGELRFLFIATGFLHGDGIMPEKSWGQISVEHMQRSYLVNAIGPALVFKHFLPLIPRQGKSIVAAVSAHVGSISENNVGGWWSYRASKSALNQIVRNASIELARKSKESVCVAVHPGPFASKLSAPFSHAGHEPRPAHEAASSILDVLHSLQSSDTGHLVDYTGKKIPT